MNDTPEPLASSPSNEDFARALEAHQELLSSVWLYIDWFGVTRQLTTPQKELFADAVDAISHKEAHEDGDEGSWSPVAIRWWRDDYDGPLPNRRRW